MEYRNIGGRSNKKYYSNKSNSNRYKFLDNYSNDINQLLSGIADAEREINILKKEHDKLSRKQMQTLDDLEKQQDNLHKRLNRIGNKTKQTLTSTDALTSSNESLFRDIQREQNKYKNLSTWYADKQETKLMNRMNEARSQMITQYINQHAYDSNGNYVKLSAEQTAKMNQEIDKKLTEQFGKDIKQFDKSVKSFGTSTGFISEIFKTLLRTTYDMGKRAADKQAGIYEDTFGNISVRTGMSRAQYYSAQRGIRGNLTSQGLLNNVGADELQTMWDKMSSNGINLLDANGNLSDAQIYANAIDLVVTNKIVPYLDTTSKAVQMLDTRIDGKFIRDIRGINLANNELVGNNYMTQDILNKLVSQVQPLSDWALETLAQGAEELTAYANKLVAEGKLSEDQVNAFINTTYKAQRYGYDMLKNGSTFEKMWTANSIINNKNPNNMTQMNDYTAIGTGLAQMMSSWTPGFENSQINSIISGAMGKSLFGDTGNGYLYLTAGNKLNQAGITAGSTLNTDLKSAQVKSYASKAYDEFALKDKNQTNKQLQNITVGNFMTEVSVVKEWMGEYSTVLETAIDKIYNLILTGAITKGISKLAGLGGSGGGIIASGGGVVLGSIGAIAAGVAITNAVASAITQSRSADAQGAVSMYENNGELARYTRTDSTGNTIEMSAGAKELLTAGIQGENIGWGAKILDAVDIIDNYKTEIGIGVSQQERNKTAYNRFMNYMQSNDYTAENTAKALLAWLMIADASGVAEDVGWDTAKIKAAFPTVYADDGDASWWINNIRGMGIFMNSHPIGDNTDRFWNPKYNYPISFDKYHRYGLSSVPYDNYPAILHQDEAVLTASTANELRNLIVEYRETNHQAINFEAIIQQQTTSLVNKLNEVVTAINNINIGTGNNNRLSIVRNKLNNSMITVTSTKSFA